jgi:hypothetical protein
MSLHDALETGVGNVQRLTQTHKADWLRMYVVPGRSTLSKFNERLSDTFNWHIRKVDDVHAQSLHKALTWLVGVGVAARC